MCRPNVTYDHPQGGTDTPFFQTNALRHVTNIQLSQAAAFVPNSVDLGVSEAPFMLLTGPNTGGKSTLMRQVRLLRSSLTSFDCECAIHVAGSSGPTFTIRQPSVTSPHSTHPQHWHRWAHLMQDDSGMVPPGY